MRQLAAVVLKRRVLGHWQRLVGGAAEMQARPSGLKAPHFQKFKSSTLMKDKLAFDLNPGGVFLSLATPYSLERPHQEHVKNVLLEAVVKVGGRRCKLTIYLESTPVSKFDWRKGCTALSV